MPNSSGEEWVCWILCKEDESLGTLTMCFTKIPQEFHGSLLWTFAPPVLGFLDGGLVDFVESSALLMIRLRWCIPSQQLGLLCTAKFKRTKKLHKSTNYHSPTVAYNFKCGQRLNSHWFPMLRDRHQVNSRARFGISFPLFVVQMWSNWEPFAFSLDQLDIAGGCLVLPWVSPTIRTSATKGRGPRGKEEDPKVETEAKFRVEVSWGPPMIFKACFKRMLRVPCFWDHVSFFCEKFIKMWNGQIWHNSIANLPKLKANHPPPMILRRSEDDRGWGESQSLGSWRGGAEENSCDSQHWV